MDEIYLYSEIGDASIRRRTIQGSVGRKTDDECNYLFFSMNLKFEFLSIYRR